MTNLVKRKLPVIIATAIFSMTLVSLPAKADHSHNVIAPVATLLVFNWLLNSRQKHYSHNTRSYIGHNQHRKAKRRNSYSQGGYHRSKRRHNHNW